MPDDWVHVQEGLPEENAVVLLVVRGARHPVMGAMRGGIWGVMYTWYKSDMSETALVPLPENHEVAYWCPLPPPREGMRQDAARGVEYAKSIQ